MRVVILSEEISVEQLVNLMEKVQTLELSNVVMQIVANVFVVIGAIFAVYQYIKQKKLTRVSNAIDLAKYFATNIVDRACLVYSVFCDNKEILSIILEHSQEIRCARDFNKKEYEKIFTEEERKKYSEFIKKRIKISGDRTIAISDIMQDAINELEHCCINFNVGLAEDKAVYQSMHQVIFNLFPCVYPWISSINESSVDLFYTNLCELFVRWNQIREKSLRKKRELIES